MAECGLPFGVGTRASCIVHHKPGGSRRDGHPCARSCRVIGVQAESIDGPGVVATNTRIRAPATSVSSNGVRAQSGTGNGINAGSVDGVGVVGNSENGYGVIGTSQSGQGVIGRSGGKGASRDLVVGEHASSH